VTKGNLRLLRRLMSDAHKLMVGTRDCWRFMRGVPNLPNYGDLITPYFEVKTCDRFKTKQDLLVLWGAMKSIRNRSQEFLNHTFNSFLFRDIQQQYSAVATWLVGMYLLVSFRRFIHVYVHKIQQTNINMMSMSVQIVAEGGFCVYMYGLTKTKKI